MAKIKNGSLVLDNQDKIIFTDSIGVEHIIYWDDVLAKYSFDGDVDAEDFIDQVAEHLDVIPPTASNDTYDPATIWLDTNTNTAYICTDNTSGNAVWSEISGGGGEITIKDEGVIVSSNVTTINFKGDQVNASESSPGVIDVYIPPLLFPSHWNTNDGDGDNTIDDILTYSRNVSAPTNEGVPFKIGTWVSGSSYPCIRLSPLVYTSPNVCLFNTLTTSIDVIIYDADGVSVIAQHTVSNISGNLSQTLQHITIDITNWSSIYDKYSADISVSIDIDSILSNGGRFSVSINHISGSSYTKTQNNIFYDSNNNPATIDNVSISANTPVIKNLSGIKYYDIGSTFDIGIGDIDYINDRSYITDFLYIESYNYYGIPNSYLEGSDLTGWNTLYNNINSSFSNTFTTSRYNYRHIGNIATIRARHIDWSSVIYASSSADSILVDTYGITSTDVAEYFVDENKRKTSSWGAWDSTALLTSSDLMVQDDELLRQFGDWTSYSPTNTANYATSASYNQFYYRGFKHDNVVHTNGQFYISGITESDITNDDVYIEISLDSTNWYVLNDDYLGGALANGDGCRTNVGITDLPLIDFTLGTGGNTDAGTGPDGYGIYVIISIPNGSLVNIGEIRLTNWS